MKLGSTQILVGDVLEQLATLPDESVHCVVTSPPYWGLRCYGVEGQLGLEETPAEYIANMVRVFDEVRRVLRSDGTLWMNLGDSYLANQGKGFNGQVRQDEANRNTAKSIKRPSWLKPKDLCGIPWRVAFALQDAGWWLRSDIIWSKPNPMPESVTDRPTKAHEYVFLLTKSARYFFDADAVREGATCDRVRGPAEHPCADTNGNAGLARRDSGGQRNIRTVWTITTQPYPEAHFATFPEALPERCIKAGTSEKGCCPECGKPWVRVVEKTGGTIGKSWHDHANDLQDGNSRIDHGSLATAGDEPYRVNTVGWRIDCECNWPEDAGLPKPVVPCTVLDPFAGSGTTLLVAARLSRNAIGIELNPDYARMAERRIGKGLKPGTYRDDTKQDDAPLFAEHGND